LNPPLTHRCACVFSYLRRSILTHHLPRCFDRYCCVFHNRCSRCTVACSNDNSSAACMRPPTQTNPLPFQECKTPYTHAMCLSFPREQFQSPYILSHSSATHGSYCSNIYSPPRHDARLSCRVPDPLGDHLAQWGNIAAYASCLGLTSHQVREHAITQCSGFMQPSLTTQVWSVAWRGQLGRMEDNVESTFAEEGVLVEMASTTCFDWRMS
jgi:hypothetical protein